jgi:Protein of unknown function (DUF3999)
MKSRNEKVPSNGAPASWTAPALRRFCGHELPSLKSGRGLPHSKTLRQFGRLLGTAIGIVFIAFVAPAKAALPADWQHAQEFSIVAPGLVKISLPVDTLDAARPALEDLRVCDDAGNELPFFITHPMPSPKAVQAAKSFHVSLQPTATFITLETGCAQPLDGVTLETPVADFIKAVRVEGSADGQSWQRMAQGQPIFRQSREGGSAGQLRVSFPASEWRWLRLTIDDQRSQPVPFTGALVHAADAETTPVELKDVMITERNENPGVTRLMLNLGAANLDVAAVKIESDEPLFTRAVTLAVPQITDDSIREQTVGQGVIYRVALEGLPPSANLSVPLEARVRARELVLLVRNEDSPPLPVNAVRVERRPVYLMFLARQPGRHYLLTGNKLCAAPKYDLAALGSDLKNAAVESVPQSGISALANNPDFRAPEALGGLEVTGAPLDVSAWKFREPIQLSRTGAQQIELDLDALAHAQPGFADLRVLQGSNQVPFIVERTSVSRQIVPVVTATNDARNPKLSRWQIKLPKSNLPLTRLTFATTTPLFQRSISLSEELPDERGDQYRRGLGSATWTQTPERKSKEFALTLDSAVQGDTLILETENGDNPPISLEKFAAFYPATRVLFKAKADDRLFLYYGNPRVPPPSYDLNLVAGELLAADKSAASLGGEEQLKKSSWAEGQTPGTGGILFWGILAVVVIGLLVIISKLLPKTQTPD